MLVIPTPTGNQTLSSPHGSTPILHSAASCHVGLVSICPQDCEGATSLSGGGMFLYCKDRSCEGHFQTYFIWTSDSTLDIQLFFSFL